MHIDVNASYPSLTMKIGEGPTSPRFLRTQTPRACPPARCQAGICHIQRTGDFNSSLKTRSVLKEQLVRYDYYNNPHAWAVRTIAWYDYVQSGSF